MLYLIFTRAITVGQFFSLFIYSFFIFGPLQELGNVINIYRETEASLNELRGASCDMPTRAAAGEPGAARRAADARVRATSTFQHQSAIVARASATSRSSVRRGETIAFVGPVGRRQDDAREAAGRPVPPAGGRILYNGTPRDRRSTSTSCASASASSPRTRSSSRARSARTCCS